MTLFQCVLRHLRQAPTASLVTMAGIAVAVSLLLTVWVVRAEVEQTFVRATGDFDAVLGPRSAPLQLVLNALFHLENWPGTMPMEDYEDLADHPAVRHAIPLAGGDNYRGFRIVGTVPELFTRVEWREGQPFRLQAGGRVFDPALQEAVIGSFVAQRLQLQPGDIFHPYHGLVFDPAQRHREEYVVVGVLEPTNTPFDRVLWIPLKGIQHMSGHDPALADRISAVLVQFHDDARAAGHRLNILYNRQGDRLTLAWPVPLIVSQFISRFTWVLTILTLLAWMITLVALTSISVALYHAMESRREEIAVFRALGARKRTIVSMVTLEALILSGLGFLLGWAGSFGLRAVMSRLLREETGVVLQSTTLHPSLWWGALLILGLGALAGLIPGLKAYRTSTARLLQEKH